MTVREAEITAVAGKLDELLDRLAVNVAALRAILAPPPGKEPRDQPQQS